PLLQQIEVSGPLASLNGTVYFVATIHRPANVDDLERLSLVLEILDSASRLAPTLFVTHPRTWNRLQRMQPKSMVVELNDDVREIRRGFVYLLPPLGYLEFLQLMSKSTAVLTDSGGVQEETTFLGIPCLTLRENTERPSTVELGTNEIVGLDGVKILACLRSIMRGTWKKASVPPVWDGRAAERVVDVLRRAYAPYSHAGIS